ncbi:MAG: DUF975 family protein [Flavobacteriales bacterium]|nr:DUF975 family protein [Flavobacteriales bacterium]
MTPNTELMSQATDSLRGKWGLAIGTFLVYMLLTLVLQVIPYLGTIVGLFIGGPFALGLIIFAKNIANDTDPKLEQIFDGFKHFGTSLATYLLAAVAGMVGFILLIIPGIIISLGLALSMYIISDDNEIGAYDALQKSWQMMKGYKMKLLGLGLMFFGLALLCMLTLGIALLWFVPFAQVTMVKFYQDVKADYEGSNTSGDFLEGGMA